MIEEKYFRVDEESGVTYLIKNELVAQFNKGCEHGDIDALKRIVADPEFTSIVDLGPVTLGGFASAVDHCHYDVANWIMTTLDTSPKIKHDFILHTFQHYFILHAFQVACAKGRLETVNWVYDTFHLTSEDARADQNWAFLDACGNGHLHVAQWLVSTFHLTADDVLMKSSGFGGINSLEIAERSHHDEIVSWLKSTFHL